MPRWKRSWLALFLLFCASAPGGVRPLTILPINDIFVHFLPVVQGRGGFAYLATAIGRERANCPEYILLNAGDLVQGTPVSTIFHGLPVFEVANLLGFDAATAYEGG